LPFHGVWVLKFYAKLNKIAFGVCCGFHKIDQEERCWEKWIGEDVFGSEVGYNLKVFLIMTQLTQISYSINLSISVLSFRPFFQISSAYSI